MYSLNIDEMKDGALARSEEAPSETPVVYDLDFRHNGSMLSVKTWCRSRTKPRKRENQVQIKSDFEIHYDN